MDYAYPIGSCMSEHRRSAASERAASQAGIWWDNAGDLGKLRLQKFVGFILEQPLGSLTFTLHWETANGGLLAPRPPVSEGNFGPGS
mmetsp:Transcript_3772/g.23794  ORF Transcript_3772/g.23794 Transcript_3772/m.23794 type:complete len:87 (+) Transcript_3772:2843-3103(+)